MKRSVIHSLGRLLLAMLLAAPILSRAAGKPNVLFIFADDMCYEAVGAMGLTDIDTPNLDRLMKVGVELAANVDRDYCIQSCLNRTFDRFGID